jgi:two-component system cell cycle response regulator
MTELHTLGIEVANKLPSPQGVALALMQRCQSEDASLAEIAALVKTDPALTGRLLGQANLASSGSRPIVSLDDAVARLGMRGVLHLALGFSLLEHYAQGGCQGFDYPAFWSQSLLMAVAMSELGAAERVGAAPELFSFGLLSGIGRLALATAFTQPYSDILRAKAAGPALLALEREKLTLDHLSLGAELMRQWGMPDIYCDAALKQETLPVKGQGFDTRQAKLEMVMYRSRQIADLYIAVPEVQSDLVGGITDFATQCGVSAEELNKTIDRIVARWRSLSAELDFPDAESGTFAEISQRCIQPEARSSAQWLRILVVEDDAINLKLLTTWLQRDPRLDVRIATDGLLAQRIATSFLPHVVLTDWQMPKMDGIALCKALRLTEWGQKMYIFMLTAADREKDLIEAFEAGVDDFVSKPLNLPLLDARMKAAWRYVHVRHAWEQDHARLTRMTADLALANRQLQQAAFIDPLTSLPNRRAGINAFAQLWSNAARHGQAFSIVSLDIDRFKEINDAHGHQVGDLVLECVGAVLHGMARTEDTVCRWGGEEFLFLLPGLLIKEAFIVAERIRLAIAKLQIANGANTLQVTVSLGVVEWRKDMAHTDQMLEEVDQHLFRAKRSGRNRVMASHL